MTLYELADQATLDLLDQTMNQYHSRLQDLGVRIGVLIALAEEDPKTGKKKGPALKGYANAPAMACIKVVPLKDRLTKGFDAELHINGDIWPKLKLEEKIAVLDHEMTHLNPTGDVDDIGRPILKLRDEDFIVWGFLEVARRHGMNALESQSVKHLVDQHGHLLLGLEVKE